MKKRTLVAFRPHVEYEARMILGMGSANKRRRYNATSSLPVKILQNRSL